MTENKVIQQNLLWNLTKMFASFSSVEEAREVHVYLPLSPSLYAKLRVSLLSPFIFSPVHIPVLQVSIIPSETVLDEIVSCAVVREKREERDLSRNPGE